MPVKAVFEDLGIIDYKKAWDYQEELHQEIVKIKSGKTDKEIINRIIFCEHPHVFTLGKSGDETNLLINDSILESINATFYRINRGGDITYHGPGQIVGYPIFDLEQFKLGAKDYIFKLEESIIKTLKEYDISSKRIKGATGVWIDSDNKGNTRKICAIGIRISKYITMHGFALNVTTDLKYFDYINPCGYTDRGVTSIKNEIGFTPAIEELKKRILTQIINEFEIHLFYF
jgi:lipoyl(octanoyl) transferase